jgi:pimeloyl-ACP methyl ester carboxylesterase
MKYHTFYIPFLSFISFFAYAKELSVDNQSKNIHLFFSEPLKPEHRTVNLFCHGIRASHRMSTVFACHAGCTTPFVSFNFADQTNNGLLLFKREEANFGQDKDILFLHEAYHTLQQSLTDQQVILWGQSRGAATIINTLDTLIEKGMKPAAVILESPYDSLRAVIAKLIRVHPRSIIAQYGEYLAQLFFTSYCASQKKPIVAAKSLKNKDIPILIICSKADGLVPWQSSKLVYDMLIKNGCSNAQLLVLEKGDHGALLDGEDGHLYKQTVHEFLNKYNLAHQEGYETSKQDKILTTSATT